MKLFHCDSYAVCKTRGGADFSQDAFLIEEDIALFAVADGMNGRPGGHEASDYAVTTLGHYYRACFHDRSRTVQQKLRGGFVAANEQVLTLGCQNEKLKGLGTTLSALVVYGEHACLAHVGDGRIYHSRGSTLNLLTEDQTVIGELLRQQRITPDAARCHPLRGMLFNNLGDTQMQPPKIVDVEIAAGDVFILTTDGVNDVVDMARLSQVLQTGTQKSAHQIGKAILAMTPPEIEDDLTAVVVALVEGSSMSS